MTMLTVRVLSYAALVAVALAVALPVAASAAPSDWSQSGQGPARHADNRGETILSRSTVGGLHRSPVIFPSRCNAGRPIVSDGVVYTAVQVASSCQIEAFAENGTPIWITDLAGSSYSNNFAVADGILVAPDFFGNLNAFDTSDGSLLWAAPAGGVSSQPVIANGVVYVDYGHVAALDLHTGNVLWTGPVIDTLGQTTPAIWHTEMFVVENNTVHAYDTGDGHALWSGSCPAAGVVSGDASPMVLKGIVYSSSKCAFDAVTGTPVALKPPKNPSVYATLATSADATGGARIFGGYRWGLSTSQQYATLEAFTPGVGAQLWHHDFAYDLNSGAWPFGYGPVAANGVVYIADQTHSTASTRTAILRAYNARTGRQLWHSKPINAWIYGISVADGRLWANLIGGTIRCWTL